MENSFLIEVLLSDNLSTFDLRLICIGMVSQDDVAFFIETMEGAKKIE